MATNRVRNGKATRKVVAIAAGGFMLGVAAELSAGRLRALDARSVATAPCGGSRPPWSTAFAGSIGQATARATTFFLAMVVSYYLTFLRTIGVLTRCAAFWITVTVPVGPVVGMAGQLTRYPDNRGAAATVVLVGLLASERLFVLGWRTGAAVWRPAAAAAFSAAVLVPGLSAGRRVAVALTARGSGRTRGAYVAGGVARTLV